MEATATKEKPILFSTEMVRAILAGRKTQTRRPVKIQPLDILTKRPPWDESVTRVFDGKRCWFYLAERDPNRGGLFSCRIGEVGDRLWVRETWFPDDDGVLYRATEGTLPYDDWKWRPSIHMPRWAARILLEITNVRIERLQQISRADVLREGVDPIQLKKNDKFFHRDDVPAITFGERWDRIYAKRGLGLKENPWVWVIEFRRIEPCKE